MARGSLSIDAGSCASLMLVIDFDVRDENLFLFDGGGHLLCAGCGASVGQNPQRPVSRRP
jgi:hypothetical protein